MGIPSKKPAFSGNSYVGRVKATSVAPPQTILLIKRRLCKIENIDDHSSSTLFLSRSRRSPENNEDRVSILTPGCPGSTPNEPIELIVKLSNAEKEVINRLVANRTCPEPKYSARATFIIPYYTFTSLYAQYTIVSTQKMGRFGLKILSIPTPMTACLLHASTTTSYHHRTR
jgi:hypothetical protein